MCIQYIQDQPPSSITDHNEVVDSLHITLGNLSAFHCISTVYPLYRNQQKRYRIKLTALQDDAVAGDEIIIRATTRHPCLERLIDLIKQCSITLKAYHNNREYCLPIETIYYIESVDGIIYLITERDSLLCRMPLYEIEDNAQHISFCKTSKYMTVNTTHLKAVESYVNHRLLLVLKNDDKVPVSRNYVEHLKKQIKKL